jgi:hypothetical protein
VLEEFIGVHEHVLAGTSNTGNRFVEDRATPLIGSEAKRLSKYPQTLTMASQED